jgi:hypothetical protein
MKKIVTEGSFQNQELENTSLNQCCQVLDLKKNIYFWLLFIYLFPVQIWKWFFLIYKSPKIFKCFLEIGLV